MKPRKYFLLIGALLSAFSAPLVHAQGLFSDVTVQRTIVFQGEVTPAQITSNQNDYSPTDLSKATKLRLSSDASRNLTGLSAAAKGRLLILTNVGSFNIVLKESDSGSTAANRFAFGTDYTLLPSGGAILSYDVTVSRWTMVASRAIAGAVGTVTNSTALTNNYIVLGNGSGDTKAAAGLTTDGTSKVILGVAGSSVGSIDFKNATSGTANIHPPTGALGSTDITTPTGTVTLETTDGSAIAANVANPNSQSGSYTLVLADRYKTLYMTSGSANALTVPPNSSVAFPIGTRIPGWTTGAGTTTITPGAGVTLNSRDAALTSAGQHAAWVLEKTATDTWEVGGDLIP